MLVAGVNFWSGEVMKKRLVSILLAFCMVTQFVPASALAAQVTDSSGSSSADVYTVTDDSDLAVPGDSDQDDSEAQADSDFTVLGGSGQNDAVAQSDGDGSNNAVVETGNDTGEVILASETESTHIHRVCGEEGCTDETNHGSEVTWTKWTETNSLPNAAGNYYLTGDVTLSETWMVKKNVTLCLNGNDIIGPNGQDAIVVNPGVSLTVTDCKDGENVGKITHNNGQEGRGVYVDSNGKADGKGTFTLWNGSITGNTIETYDANIGAGVHVSGTFNMYGGTITNNKAYSGAGVGNFGTFNMGGGTITNNTALAAVGGGVCNRGSSTFNVWGSVHITGNKSTSTADGIANNVYLDNEDRTVTVEEGKSLSSNSRIGITSSAPQNSPTVVSGSADKTIFSSDNSYYSLVENSSGGLMLLAEHSHAICGKTDCTHEGHSKDDVWTAWDSTTSLPTQEGNYYLIYNVELSSTWEVSNDVNLCLNGKIITGASGQDAIKVTDGKTLTITDCQTDAGKITHKSGEKGCGVTVESNGALTMWNGSIQNNSVEGEAGGVYNNGTLTMYGGSITGNSASGNAGGVYNNGTFNLSGGSVTGNSAQNAGGVYNNGTFNLTDGSIANNSATNGNGGGVYNSQDGAFSMTGGSVTGNSAQNGGGFYGESAFTMSGGSITGNSATANGGGVCNQGTITVSGSAIIKDNTVGDETNNETNNVYLSTGQQITVATDGMGSAASVGVTTQNPDDDPILVPNVSTTTGFFSDDANHELVVVSGSLRLSKVHKHKLCGKTDCDDTHAHSENIKWEAWTSTDSLPSKSGNYYLDNDVTLNDKGAKSEGLWEPNGNINLCLNGHTITGAKTQDSLPYEVIYVDKGVSLTITDCHDGQSAGKVTHDKGVSGGGVEVRQNGTFSLWNGSITDNTGETGTQWGNFGSGLGVANLGTFNMYGGSISGNSAYLGGGVANYATFTMSGGSITGNSARAYGGGVYNKDGTFTMSGGTITGNTATGTSILSSSALGGGVYNDGTFNLSGNVTITDNTAKGAPNNVYITTATVTFTYTHPINVTETMDAGAKVGITANEPWESHTVVTNSTDTNVFFSDDEGYEIAKDTNNNALKLVAVLASNHKHKICGDDSCEDPDHSKEIDCGAITSLDQITSDGDYYLNADVTLTDTWECSYKVNLCLNGHTITGPKDKDAIKVKGGASLTITDCKQIVGKITHKEGETGRGVNVVAGGTLTLYNGSITGNTAATGTTGTGDGAGVYNYGTFTMHGGSITGNSASCGAGIYNSNSSTFTMKGGGVTDNTASSNGGGVENYGTITMSGGSITGNRAGNLGGGVNDYGQFNLSGDVTIEDNTAGSDEQNAPSNVYLCLDSNHANAKIVVTGGSVGENASVGITANQPENSPTVVTGTTNTSGFFSDSVAYALKATDTNDGLKLVGKSDTAHKHNADCGDTTQGNELTWTPIASLADIKDNGNYYLTRRVNLSETWTCNYDVNLCLNGYDIIGADLQDTIKVSGGKTLTITDCQETAGKITHKSGDLGRGVYVDSNGTLTLWNGNITGNTASSNGAGVYNLGELKLSGNVTISGNTVNGAANNVYLSTGKKITVTGTAMGQSASVGILAESPDGNPVVVEGTSSLTGFSSDDEDYKLVADTEKNQIKLSETHEHKVCVDESCSDDSHPTLGWKAISSLDEITADGNYCLKNDVTLDATWKCKYKVNLCLNGKTITGPAGEEAIEVYYYINSLTITDCHEGNEVGKITHNSGDLGGGVEVCPYGTFILWNGSITGNSPQNNIGGGGVYNFGTFEMHGGSITGNFAVGNQGYGSNGGGGGVKNRGDFTMFGGSITNNSAEDRGAGVENHDMFIMHGGTIAGNSAKNGAGVYNANGTVSISGGSITGNKVTEKGAGVYNLEGRTLHMTGGSITGNTANENGGGVCNGGTFNLSGNVTIKDNKVGNADQNVYLPSGKTIAAAEGGMDSGASVGITAEKPVDGPLVVTGASAATGFSSDDTDYSLVATSDGLILSKAHRHAVCGKTDCDHEGHGADMKWEPWTKTDSLPDQAGNYYLENNVTLTKVWSSPNNVNLCLNGKTITQTSGVNAIEVDGSLTITDCHDGDEVGKITHKSGETGSGVSLESTYDDFTLWNGTITGNSTSYGGGVSNRGTFKMYGGAITGNSTTYDGAGVYIYDKGSFTMAGGSITDNVAKYFGGGVFSDGALSLSGNVTIDGNHRPSGSASNVHLYKDKTINVAEGGMGESAHVGITAEYATTKPVVVNGTAVSTGFYSDDSDYELVADGNNSLRLSTKPVTISGVKLLTSAGGAEMSDDQSGTKSKIYDAQAVAYAGGVTVSKSIYGASLDYAWQKKDGESYTGTNNNQAPKDAGEYKLVVTYKKSSTVYGTAEVPFTITAAELGVTVTADSKPYDGTTDATVTATLDQTGILAGDTVTLDSSNMKATFDSVAVGNNKTITVNGLKLAGDAAGNYKLPDSITATANITKAAGSGSVTLEGWTYGDQANTPVVSSDTNGTDNVTYQYKVKGAGDESYTGEKPTASGDYTVKATFAETDNYEAATATDDFTIAKKQLTITGADVAEKTYDGETGADVTAVSFDGLVGSDALVLDTDYIVFGAAFDSADVASATKVDFSVALKDTDVAKNYVLSSEKGSQDAKINKATFENRAFNAEGHRGQSNTCEVPADYVVDGGQVTVSVEKDENGILAGTPAYADGKLTYTLKADAADGQAATVKLTVSSANYNDYAIAATLGVTAKEEVEIHMTAGEHTYDGAAHAPASITVYGDKVDAASLVKTYEGVGETVYRKSTQAPTAAGTYSVTVSVADTNTKYYGSASCELEIKPAALTVSVSADDKEYDGTTTATLGDAALSGVLDADKGKVELVASHVAAAFKDENAGTGKPVDLTGGYALSGDAAKNYTVAQPTGLAASITAKTLSVTVTVQDKTYDGKTETTIESVSLGDVVSNDKVEADQSEATAAFDSAAAGDSKTVIVTGLKLTGDDKGNYKLPETVTCTGKIAKRAVKLASESHEFTYNGQAQKWEKATVAAGSFADGEGVGSYTFSGSATNVGDSVDNTFTYVLKDGTSADNYDFTTTYGKLTVVKSGAMTVSGISYDGVYDGQVHGSPAKASVTEGTTVEYSTDGQNWSEAAPTVKDFADVTVKVRATNPNYEQAEATYTLKVTKRPVTFAGKSDAKTYNGSEQSVAGYTTNDGEGTGLVDGQTANVEASASGMLPGTTAGTITAAKDVTIRDAQGNDVTGNYSITTNPGSMTINKVGGTITVIAASASKTYDGAPLTNDGFAYTRGVLLDGDVLTAEVSGSATNVGDGGVNAVRSYKVTRGETDVTGAYTFAESVAGKLMVKPAELTITGADVAEKTYDGKANADVTAVSFDGLVGSESLAIGTDYAVTGAAFDSADVASATKVTFSVKLAETGIAKNYTLKSAAGEQVATIKKAAVGEGLSFADDGKRGQENTCDVPAGYVVDGGQVTVSVEKDENGILAGTPAYADGKLTYALKAGAADGQTATVKLTVASGNYEDYAITATLGVTAKEQVEIHVAAGEHTYDGQAQGPTDIKVKDDKVAASDLVKTYVGTGVTKYGPSTQAPTAAGAYSVTVSVAGTNLEYTGSASCAFQIAKRAVGVKGLSVADKTYDGTTSATIAGTPSVDGAVEGDDVALVNGAPTFASAAVGEKVPVSFTDFSLTGAAAGNYELAQPTGVTASIRAYEAAGSEYAATTGEWTNQDFTVTAAEGWKVSLSDAADADWRDSLICSEEGEGSLTFYVRNDAQGYISTAVTRGYKIDKTAPSGKVEIGKDFWTSFLETVTFGLYRNDKQTVTLAGTDALSGVSSTEYLVTDKDLGVEQLAGEEFTAYEGAFDIEPDAEVIVYARVTDVAGNVTYLRSDGVVLDATAPVIAGADNGRTYCGPVELTVSDANLDAVTLNGEPVGETEAVALAADADAAAAVTLTVAPAAGEQVVIATDKAGNVTTLSLTVNDGHTWGAWSSNGDGTHTRACKYDASHSETADCHGGEATCTERAVCDDCGGEYGEIDPDNHADLVHVEAKEATTADEGNAEYWYCPACGKLFSDAAGQHEVSRADIVIARKPAEPEGEKDGSAGAEAAAPGDSAGAKAAKSPTKAGAPQTGDAAADFALPALLGIAAAACALVSARKRRDE